MSQKVGLFAGLGLVVLLVSGLVAGVALAQGGGDESVQVERQSFASRVASHLGVTEQELVDAFKAARLDMLDEALAEGKITQEQADKIRQRIEESQGLGFGLRSWRLRALGGIVSSVAEALDMAPREIVRELKDGQSLAEIGEAKGVSADTLKDAILTAAQDKLDQAVAAGKLTQEQADNIMARLTNNIDKILNWRRSNGEELPRRYWGMPWGPGPLLPAW